MKTQFEEFLSAYLEVKAGEKQEKFIVIINGVTVATVIESRQQLDEAIEGALAINPDSEIQVFEQVAYEAEAEDVNDEVEETEEVVDTTEPDTTEPDTVEESAEEAPKDLPRNDKFMDESEEPVQVDKKAAKKAKKKAKKAKKAKKKAQKAASVTAPVVTKKVVKEKTTTTTKAVASTQPVAKLHKESGAILKEYDSISHAAEDSGVHSTNISKVCRGIRGSAGGFGWKYL